jgi:hypothetical protein
MPSVYDNVYAQLGLDTSGINPAFQDIRKQQQYQNQQFGQQNSVSEQGFKPSNLSGLNPLAMASMLRGNNPYAKNKGDPYLNAETAMKLNDPSNVYGYGGLGQVPTSWSGEP